MRQRIALLAALFVAIGNLSANAWVRTPPPTSDAYWGIENKAISMSYIYNVHSTLISMKSGSYDRNRAKVTKVSRCKSFPSSDCPLDQYQYYNSPLGMCKDFKTDCIDSVYAELNGQKLEVKFVRYFPESSMGDFVGNLSYNLPTPGNSFIVSIPQAPHKNGDLYLVAGFIWGDRFPGSPGKFETADAEAAIIPIYLISGKFEVVHELLDPATYNGLVSTGVGGSCLGNGIQNTETECALVDNYPEGISLGLRIKLTTKTENWFHGRISNVEVNVTGSSKSELLLDIKGEPVKVPTIFGWVKKELMPEGLRNFYSAFKPGELQQGSGYGCISGNLGPCNPSEWVSTLRTAENSELGMRELSFWLPILGDKAAASESTWFIRSMRSNIPDQCAELSNQFLGTVSTNANSYLPGAPSFNSSTLTLDYKILAPHFLEDGSVFKGTYDLTINSKLARCIYGFTEAPVSASVTVVSENGDNQVSTAVTSESGGYLRVSVRGFTFSNPILRVKLQQQTQTLSKSAGASEVTQTPTTAPTKASNSKGVRCINGKTDFISTTKNPVCPVGYIFILQKTITCKMGSSIKKVVGEQPDCPRGYVKIATSTPKFSAKSKIKTLWCLEGNVAIQVAGLKPKCPAGMSAL